MAYRIVVCAKQVPDTKNITGQAMKEDGTVNRAALPAIFNPEDLNALEFGLSLRDQYGGTVTVVTMGPPGAAEILRESLARGADRVALLTDRRFAAADTLATSATLAAGIETLGGAEIVICGRQAIDGDTAQIGPQLAGRLGIPQVTYVEALDALVGSEIQVRRNLEHGHEVVKARLPVLLTIVGTANTPRPRSAKRLLRYRRARSRTELLQQMGTKPDDPAYLAKAAELEARGLLIPELTADSIRIDLAMCGAAGSPTKVKKIESVVLTSREQKRVEPTQEGVRALIRELIAEHTLD